MKMRKSKYNNQGFSLVELIIVVGIMAVLLAVIAPNLTKYLGTAKEQKDESDKDAIKGIIERVCTRTAEGVSAPPTGSWIELKEGSSLYDEGAADWEFAKEVAKEMEKVPKSRVTNDYFWVKITGSSDESYEVSVSTTGSD